MGDRTLKAVRLALACVAPLVMASVIHSRARALQATHEMKRALERNDYAAVRRLAPLALEVSPAPLVKPPLLLALEHDDLETARLLVKRGADVNAVVSGNHDAPLNVAVRKRNVEAVRLLLAYGAQPHAPDERRRTPFTQAQRQLDALREQPSSREHPRRRAELERCRLIAELLR